MQVRVEEIKINVRNATLREFTQEQMSDDVIKSARYISEVYPNFHVSAKAYGPFGDPLIIAVSMCLKPSH